MAPLISQKRKERKKIEAEHENDAERTATAAAEAARSTNQWLEERFAGEEICAKSSNGAERERARG